MPRITKSEEKLVNQYVSECGAWLRVLQKYHKGRFQTNWDNFTALPQTKGTHTKISDSVTPEIVERIIQKTFEAEPTFLVEARGIEDIPRQVTDIMAAVAKYYWNHPMMIQSTGTMRAKCKLLAREFVITGNASTETYFNAVSKTPDMRVTPVEDVIFNPARTLKTSDVYYIKRSVSLDYLKNNAEEIKDGKVVKGLFKNIKRLEESIREQDDDQKKVTQDTSENRIKRSGSDTLDKNREEVELLIRWEGTHCIVIANQTFIIRDVVDPLDIGEDPLDFAMDIEVPKEPYAFSVLDFISGPAAAKNLLLNQVIDYGAKLLNPPTIVDPSLAPINQATLRNMYKLGGIVFANPQLIEQKPMAPFPIDAGMNMLGYLQQRSESVSGAGPYLSGVPNQQSDKTQGTKGGIQTLVAQGSSLIIDKQINLEESIIEPVVNKWIKMAGNLMAENEVKYVMITGEQSKWIKVTKGLLTGKVTLYDLYMAEIIDEELAADLAQEMKKDGKNPSKDTIFEADWLIKVEEGSLAEQDEEKDLEAFDGWVKMCLEIGQPLDIEKIAKERGHRAKVKEPEQYMVSQDEMPQTGMENMQGGMPIQGGMQQQMM